MKICKIYLISALFLLASAFEVHAQASIEKIAFHSARSDQTQIYIMNIDGSDQRPLTTDDDSENLCPAISPDGSKIVFISERDGQNQIYIMNIDGSDQRRLTESSAGESPWPMQGPHPHSRTRAPADIISASAPVSASIFKTALLPGTIANSTILFICLPFKTFATIIKSE